jgi:polyisoprenoid-binding protein YceI
MALRGGTFTIGPADGTLLVRTKREGAAGRIGHDLTLVATRWKAVVRVDVRVPSRSTLRATVDSGSLEVREASGGAIGLTDSQRAEVEANIREKVLRASRHPKIRFTSTEVTGDATRVSVSGKLTIVGKTRPATLAVRVSPRSRMPRVRATTSIVQTEFGIEPYSALFGALRVKDVVELAVDVRLGDG